MYRKTIKEYINSYKEEIINLWEKVVNTDSGSRDLEGLAEVSDILENELEKTGFEVKSFEFENAGKTLVGIYNKENKKEPILFLGHMDTVFSEKISKDRPFKIIDGIAYGPGVLDMKIGLIIGIYVTKILKKIEYSDRPIKFIISGDEETAHVNTKSGEIIEQEAKGCYACFNFESGRVDEGIVVGRKGTRAYNVNIKGQSAHSGNDPDIGRSAILEAAYKVIELEKLNDIPRGKLVNCGVISGGVSDNTIPGDCSIEILTRYINNNIGEEIVEEVDEILKKTYVDGTSTTFIKRDGIPAMESTEDVMSLFNLVKETAKELGFNEPNPKQVGGGSDSAFTVKAGVPTVCAMGVKGEFNHTEREYAVVDSVFERIELVTNTILKIENYK